MAIRTNLLIYPGEDVVIPFVTYTTDAALVADNISGDTMTFTVARTRNSPTKLISKSGAITVAASGTWTVTIGAADTQDIAPGIYFWDAWKTNSGSARLLGYGRFTIGDTARLPT